jgi:hypothetical protein
MGEVRVSAEARIVRALIVCVGDVVICVVIV